MYLWFIDIQHSIVNVLSPFSCDLLSKCIFDLLIFNRQYCSMVISLVVICFQNVSLIYWYSTKWDVNLKTLKLWFAFKMYLWFIDIQPAIVVAVDDHRCDLLSKCIFDLLIFNHYQWNNQQLQLWFAFKMYLWFIDIQHKWNFFLPKYCCDLLSKCIFDLLIFNVILISTLFLCVVICFQNVSLIYWYSTMSSASCCLAMLWFAFKMYLWFIDIQQVIKTLFLLISCDLLSKCIFDLLIFNRKFCKYWLVVLWFAFKMYLWFIDIQHFFIVLISTLRCDLLSKCIFDLLIFNSCTNHEIWFLVVICFQNVSLIYWYSTR